MTSDPPAGPEPAGAIAVLGTGIMGSVMARNLIAAGLHTTVWDQSREATAPFAAAGAVVASSAQDAIADARVVITVLPTADVTKSVIFGHGLPPFAQGELPMLYALSRQWHTAVEAGYGRDDISAARLALGGPARMEG
jgi:ketol-acid reductoisomerase